MLTTWILVLSLLKVDGTGTAARFGPFRSLEACQQAGEKWLGERVGNPEVHLAAWDCRVNAR